MSATGSIRAHILLYLQAHRAIPLALIGVVALVVALGSKGVLIPLPWLNSIYMFTIGSVVAIIFSLLLMGYFRNEVSRMEGLTPARWIVLDSAIVIAMWALFWGLALQGMIDAQVPYVFGLLSAIAIVLGRWLRTDTLVLVTLGVLLVQSALWTVWQDTLLKYACFFFATPPLAIMMVLSGLAVVALLPALPAFKVHG